MGWYSSINIISINISINIISIYPHFLSFIPKPVTEHSTVYISMLNFVKMTNRLDQEALNLFCDEGIFRIVLDINVKKKDGFCNIIPLHPEVYPRL